MVFVLNWIYFLDVWFLEEMNDGKIENLFFMLVVLMVVNMLVFVVVVYFYKYKVLEEI